jgi:4-amino-4-deoxy-L-arabinose transferase-like glycosyltransferase
MDREIQLSTSKLIALWLVAGVALILFLDRAPVQRTQEARVMETAREMLGRPTRDWLIPKLNGEVRLRKPPLAYWLSAEGFEAFGVKAWAGRLPMALAGWLTIGISYAFAARAFDRFTGLLAGAALLGSYMFYRYTRLAETDALAMLFVTLAMYAIWRGSKIWLRVAAASAALAMMSKGAPACLSVDLSHRAVSSGAKLQTLDQFSAERSASDVRHHRAAVVDLRRAAPESKQISQELSVLLTGENHGRPLWDYFPQVLIATLPWTPMVIIGIVLAAKRWKTDARLRTLLIWSLAIFRSALHSGQQAAALPAAAPAAADDSRGVGDREHARRNSPRARAVSRGVDRGHDRFRRRHFSRGASSVTRASKRIRSWKNFRRRISISPAGTKACRCASRCSARFRF